jgi:hypothetical protein
MASLRSTIACGFGMSDSQSRDGLDKLAQASTFPDAVDIAQPAFKTILWHGVACTRKLDSYSSTANAA